MAKSSYDPNEHLQKLTEASLSSRRKIHTEQLNLLKAQYDEDMSKYKDNEAKKIELTKDYVDKVKKYKELAELDLDNFKIKLQDKSSDYYKHLINVRNTYEKNTYNSLNKYEQAIWNKNKVEKLTADKEYYQEALLQLKQQQEVLEKTREAIDENNEAELEALSSQLEFIQNEIEQITAETDTLEDNLKQAEEAAKSTKKYLGSKELAAEFEKELEKKKKDYEIALAKSLDEELSPDERKDAKKEAQGLSAEIYSLEQEKSRKEAREHSAQLRQDFKHQLTTLAGWKKSLEQGITALNDYSKKIDQNMSSFFEYQGQMEARLQGSESIWSDSIKTISKTIGLSGVVSQKKMVENLKTLVETGTNYNLELRAYLATVSENIASTFNAFDNNLLKIIRLQQQDSTAARLGMEASLTKTFNSMFSDTNYLNDMYDTVSQAITDASGLLTYDMSTEFEYVVQKWLGSLYSVGVSNQAVSTIAQGINLLGSGNIESLSSNDTLMTLLAMSAVKGGTSLDKFLIGGASAEETNKLLKGMVNYLADIADNTQENQVVKSAYANLLGLSSTDIKAISNLSNIDIDTIERNSLNYAGSIQETVTQLNAISDRVHLSSKINTVIENALTGTTVDIGSNSGVYGTWKVLQVVDQLTNGSLTIPAIGVMGNFLELKSSIPQLAIAGITGISLIGQLLSGISNMSSGGLPNLSAWGDYTQSISRGSGIEVMPEGVQKGLSKSTTFVNRGSSSADDIENSTLQDAADKAEDTSAITNQNVEGNADFYDQTLLYLETICDLLGYSLLGNAEYNQGGAKLLAVNRLIDNPWITEEGESSTASFLTNLNRDTVKASLDVHVVNDLDRPVNMKLTGITDDVKMMLESRLKALLISAFSGESEFSETGEEIPNMLTQLRSVLEGLDVTVVNDRFDEFLQQNSLIGI